MVNAVKVGVMQRQAALVAGGQHESRAARIAGRAQPLRDTLHQAGLAGAQRPGKHIDIAGLRVFADYPAHGAGSVGVVGMYHQRMRHKN